jgi:hypothetical protein
MVVTNLALKRIDVKTTVRGLGQDLQLSPIQGTGKGDGARRIDEIQGHKVRVEASERAIRLTSARFRMSFISAKPLSTQSSVEGAPLSPPLRISLPIKLARYSTMG